MSDVFISYARSTEKQARQVAEVLQAMGYTVWRDKDLLAHRAYTEAIEEQLKSAKAVVVVWSAEAVKSQWVQSEADAARAEHKLVQLTTDGAKLPMPFDRIQCADLAGWAGETDAHEWRKVVSSIKDLAGDPGSGLLPAKPRAAAEKRAEPLLAVLAFDNLSGDSEMVYFSDGVSEEILQTVARGADIKVVARSSSFQFRGANKAIRHVATELKTSHVLDGSVRRSGTRVRISASLVECASQTTLWSDRFDRELSDVFALQDEIATNVAAALKIAFEPTAKSEVVDPAAYSLYLKALEIRNRGLEKFTRLAVIKMLETATELAPNFARAWVFLATVQAAYIRLDLPVQSDSVMHAKVVRAAETSLKLDPGLGDAYQALGQLEPYGLYTERETLHRKALSVAANDPTVLTNASLFFAEIGQIQEALGFAKRAYELDPMYPWAANWYAAMLGYAGLSQECLALARALSNRWPDNELIAWNAMFVASSFGDWAWFDDLVKAAQALSLDSPSVRSTISLGRELRNPNQESRERILKSARRSLARTGFVPLERYPTMYKLGLHDEVFELIDQISFAFMFDPQMQSPSGSMSDGIIFNALTSGSMMRDVRFVGLCAKLGLCDYWIKTERWPDCADAVASQYDFKAEARRLVAA